MWDDEDEDSRVLYGFEKIRFCDNVGGEFFPGEVLDVFVLLVDNVG